MFFPALFALVILFPQSQQPSSPQDGLALLNEVGQRYANAKSYHIEAVKEHSSSNELSRSWQKSFLKGVVMPGGRYRYEGRSGFGDAAYVSDGKTAWVYHGYEHRYTQKPAEGDKPKHRIISGEEMAILDAEHLVQLMAHRPDHLKSATLLPEETVAIGGKELACYVVRYSQDDLKNTRPDQKEDWILWIRKDTKTVVKTVSHAETFLMPAHIPLSTETTVIYQVVELEQQEPAATFTFEPPQDAKLVDAFPDPFRQIPPANAEPLLGKAAPALVLKAADGKTVSLSSLRGKPVFLEFWSTWCEPCLEIMPELKTLYAQTESKGLEWISIDSDEDASTASKFLAREDISWANYHDEDGSLGRAYQREGIPLGVLIDADGKIVFYKSGYEVAELKNAISKLGSQFSALALPAGTAQ